MDEQKQPEQQPTQEFGDTVKGVVQAGKAAVKAATGDVVGAAKDIATNPMVIKVVIAIVLGTVLLFTAASMIIGSAITGTIEYLYDRLEENWNEAWEEQGVSSSGNLLYLYGIGSPLAAVESVADTISDTITDLCNTVSNWINGENATNASLGANKSTKTDLTNEDYRNTLASIKDEEKLVSDDGALKKRLDMIKGRVEERGNQLRAEAGTVYTLEGIAFAIGEVVSGLLDTPIALFCGIDWDNSGINIDTSAFEMTDVQALKIYAAYCVQKDCQLDDIDMWDLMNYCGWYSILGGKSPLESDEQSIYNSSSAGTFLEEFAGVISSGADLLSVYPLPAPYVPTWSGTFAPQWYYEEIAQLQKSNDLQDSMNTLNGKLANAGMETTEDSVVFDNPYFETDSDGKIDTSNFAKLSSFEPYGLIDKIFVSSRASATISRTDYHGADEYAREALANFEGNIRALWDEAYGPKSKTTSNGNTVSRNEDGVHSFTINSTTSGWDYYLTDTAGNVVTSVQTSSGGSITFSGLSGEKTYYAYAKIPHYTEIPDPEEDNDPTEPGEPTEPDEDPTEPTNPPRPNRPDEATPTSTLEKDSYVEEVVDLGYGVKEIRLVRKTDSAQVQKLATQVTYTYSQIDGFTTFVDAAGYQAYKVQVRIDISFASRSIDALLYDMMGLWPGSLSEVVEKDGQFYAKGYTDNENLVLNWTDTYTDSSGNTYTIEFERQQGYQVEAYQDIVLGLGSEEVLNLPVSNLFSSYSYGSGQSIVNVARQELEYYTSNGLYEGARYWNMAYENGGMPYAENGSTAWCVMFVMCCAWMAGLIGEGAPWGPMDTLDGHWPWNCTGSVNEMEQAGNGTFYDTSDYKPAPGDFIYFSQTGSFSNVHHIGLVADVLADGSIEVIHGNWSNKVQSTFCDGYQVGTRFGGSTYICAYFHPNYPALLITEPTYLSITGSLQPKTTARYVTAENTSILIAGVGRFREDQLASVVDVLKKEYPELYKEELQTALDNDDMNAFIAAWNALAASEQAEAFENAQTAILMDYYIEPLAAEVEAECGFDWLETEIRENLLLGIATTSSNRVALKTLMVKLAEGLEPTISDGLLLQALTENDGETTKLYDICYSMRGMLWSGESELMKTNWLSSIQRLLEELQAIWNASGAAFGDPSSPVQDQVYYYLTRSMGLNSAAACGVLANIEYESSFNLNTVGDYGTSYGLCQWHNGRWTNLMNYCSNHGLDYTTVQGQMEFLRYELETSYPSVLSHLRSVENSAQGAYSAASYWCIHFEVPSNKEQKAVVRGTSAQDKYWPQYGGK